MKILKKTNKLYSKNVGIKKTFKGDFRTVSLIEFLLGQVTTIVSKYEGTNFPHLIKKSKIVWYYYLLLFTVE